MPCAGSKAVISSRPASTLPEGPSTGSRAASGDGGPPSRLTLLCQDRSGYLALSRLISRAFLEGHAGDYVAIEPEWQGRGLGAHLLAEALVRWHRDLPWSPPIRFAASAYHGEATGFIEGFGMEEARPGDEAVDGHARFTRVVDSVEELYAIVRSARAAADRKGRVVAG